jgi:hypothetical protein
VLNLEVADGTLDLATTFAFAPSGNATGLTMSDGTAAMQNLQLLFPGERDPLWRVPEIAASGVNVDVDHQSITSINSSAKRASAAACARRRRQPRLGPLDPYCADHRYSRGGGAEESGVPVPAPQPPPPSPSLASASPAEPTWQLNIRRAAFERWTLDFEDRQPGKPVVLRFTELDARARIIRTVAASRAR